MGFSSASAAEMGLSKAEYEDAVNLERLYFLANNNDQCALCSRGVRSFSSCSLLLLLLLLLLLCLVYWSFPDVSVSFCVSPILFGVGEEGRDISFVCLTRRERDRQIGLDPTESDAGYLLFSMCPLIIKDDSNRYRLRVFLYMYMYLHLCIRILVYLYIYPCVYSNVHILSLIYIYNLYRILHVYVIYCILSI